MKQHLCPMLAALLLVALCSGIHSSAAQGGQTTEKRYVLVVAHNRSLDQGVPALRFADDDGARYWELFRTAGARVRLLTVLDPDTARTHPEAAQAAKVPWLRNLRSAVNSIADQIRRDNQAGSTTIFTFIYVGHGNVAKDGEGYVNLQDVRFRRRDLFQEVVSKIPATTVHLLIDACKSFYLVSRGPEQWKDDRAGRTYSQEVKAFLSESSLASHPHVGVILSTSGDEEVHEWSAFRSGVFSYQLRSAISGGADLNSDGKVEYSEVGAFVAAANRRVAHQRAQLRPFIKPPRANLHAGLLQMTRQQALRLQLSRALTGRITIEDERGVRILDINKSSRLKMQLLLTPKRRHFVRHRGQEAIVPRGKHGALALSSLPLKPIQSSPPRGSLDQSYRNDMFAIPLSRSFYEGYLAQGEMPSIRFDTTDLPLPALPAASPRWGLELSYLLSSGVLDSFSRNLQHTLAISLQRELPRPFYLCLSLELGISSLEQQNGAADYSLYRTAILAGAGVRWRFKKLPLAVAIEGNAGYQALFSSVHGELDPSSAKFGGQLVFTYAPVGSLHRLKVVARTGIYGHLVTVVPPGQQSSREQISAAAEGGIGLRWSL